MIKEALTNISDQLEQVSEAIADLGGSVTVDFDVDTYNLFAGFYQEQERIANALERIATALEKK